MKRKLPKDEEFRPTSTRTRLLIVVLAVLTAGLVMYAVLDPQARLERMQRPPADRAVCQPGQTENCVGGKVDVIMVPAAPASARR